MPAKSNGGRPKIPVNLVTASRIKQLRESHREKQSDIAKVLNYTALTVARFEKGERGIPMDCLYTLARHWDVPVAYLTGETNKKTILEYTLEVEDAESQGEKAYLEEQHIQHVKLENFFAQCGFMYRNLYDTKENEFLPITDPEKASAPHQIFSNEYPNDISCFTDDELTSLFSKVHRLIEFECFLKNKKA